MAKIAREEFDRFWAETFGKDWYIDEGDVDDETSPLVEIGDMVVAWQGTGDGLWLGDHTGFEAHS